MGLRISKRELLAILILAGFVVLRWYFTRPVYVEGDRVRITSRVYSDPARYSSSQYFRIEGLGVYLPPYPQIDYGDMLVIEGVVVEGKLIDAKVIKTGDKNISSKFRKKIIDFYEKFLPQPESGLMAGIVLGSKGSVSQKFYEATKKTGVAHVVVASGTNVSFVAAFLIATLGLFMSRRKMIVFVILGIILYLFMSGFDAPLIRAGIMTAALFTAEATGRVVSAWRVFFLTVCLMLLIKPEWLIDLGFILSFVSTGSLLLFEKRIRTRLGGLPMVFREGLSTSLAAQIGVAPVIFVTFGQFNALSPIINALVLWTISLIMVLGAVGGVVGLAFPLIGKLILWLGYPLLWWFVKIVEIFNHKL